LVVVTATIWYGTEIARAMNAERKEGYYSASSPVGLAGGWNEKAKKK